MSTTVFVSGATGFIAQHIIKLLLSKKYRVVGSVRSAEKGSRLQTLYASDHFSYEVVPEIISEGAFDAALKKHPEVTVFLHTASPVNFSVTNVEEDLLKPAVHGTKNVFRAIKAHAPQIKHVVVTSSVVAMYDIAKSEDPNYVVSETSWSPITWEESKVNAMTGYFGSKKFAEEVAWSFYENENPAFTLNVVNPVYVFGPQAFDSEVKTELNFSSEIINKLLKLTPDSPIEPFSGHFIDVRDVAKAHLAAFEDGFSQKRLLMVNEHFTNQGLINIMNENFESLRGKIPIGTTQPSSDDEKNSEFENKKTRDLLKFPLIDLKTSTVDTVTQILKATELRK